METTERETKDFYVKTSIVKTTYNTDDGKNPKESIILYGHFQYYKGGGRTDFLWFSLVVRQKSKIVYREHKVGDIFEEAMVRYCRVLRNRANEEHPFVTMINDLERFTADPVKEASR